MTRQNSLAGPLYIVPWRCTFACDLNCAHCTSAGKPKAAGELITADAKKLVDRIHDFGATFLGITGGEPFLREDLFQIVRYAKKVGLQVSIITDGHLVDDKSVKNIVRSKMRVSISIDGAEKVNDRIRGKGTYKSSVSLAKKLSGTGLLDCFVYTFANIGKKVTNVTEENFRHVNDLAAKYGARWVVYHGLVPYTSNKKRLKADPSPALYEWAMNKLYDLSVEYKGKPFVNVYVPFYARVAKQRGIANFDDWYNGFFLGKCWFGRFMSIAENGDAIPCSYNDVYRFGNVKDKSLLEIWDGMQSSVFFAKARDKANIKGKCGVCEYKNICGGCRTAALFYTGDWLESDPRCAYVPKAIREKT
jgi:radical SAM protein with 4Fe4S-binding SPASM domain